MDPATGYRPLLLLTTFEEIESPIRTREAREYG